MKLDLGPDRAQVRLAGEIDIAWVEKNILLIARLFDDFPRLVIVDVEEATFMDSTGFGFLARCIRACQFRGRQVIVVGPNPFIRPAQPWHVGRRMKACVPSVAGSGKAAGVMPP